MALSIEQAQAMYFTPDFNSPVYDVYADGYLAHYRIFRAEKSVCGAEDGVSVHDRDDSLLLCRECLIHAESREKKGRRIEDSLAFWSSRKSIKRSGIYIFGSELKVRVNGSPGELMYKPEYTALGACRNQSDARTFIARLVRLERKMKRAAIAYGKLRNRKWIVRSELLNYQRTVSAKTWSEACSKFETLCYQQVNDPYRTENWKGYTPGRGLPVDLQLREVTDQCVG